MSAQHCVAPSRGAWSSGGGNGLLAALTHDERSVGCRASCPGTYFNNEVLVHAYVHVSQGGPRCGVIGGGVYAYGGKVADGYFSSEVPSCQRLPYRTHLRKFPVTACGCGIAFDTDASCMRLWPSTVEITHCLPSLILADPVDVVAAGSSHPRRARAPAALATPHGAASTPQLGQLS